MSPVTSLAKGFRTVAAAGAFVTAGLLSVAGSIDLTPVVSLFVRNPAYLGAAMCGVGLLFGWLRYLTTTPFAKTDVESPDPKHGIEAGE